MPGLQANAEFPCLRRIVRRVTGSVAGLLFQGCLSQFELQFGGAAVATLGIGDQHGNAAGRADRAQAFGIVPVVRRAPPKLDDGQMVDLRQETIFFAVGARQGNVVGTRGRVGGHRHDDFPRVRFGFAAGKTRVALRFSEWQDG